MFSETAFTGEVYHATAWLMNLWYLTSQTDSHAVTNNMVKSSELWPSSRFNMAQKRDIRIGIIRMLKYSVNARSFTIFVQFRAVRADGEDSDRTQTQLNVLTGCKRSRRCARLHVPSKTIATFTWIRLSHIDTSCWIICGHADGIMR